MVKGRKPMKKKPSEFELTEENGKKELNGSEEEVQPRETPNTAKAVKKRTSPEFDPQEAMGSEVHSMLERFGADISKAMQAKKKRLELLTKTSMKESQLKVEQLWNNAHTHRKKMTQQYSQKVTSALQEWETEAQRAAEQEETLNNLFRQHQKVLQQLRAARDQKLKSVQELYELFVKDIEDLEKSQEAFLQGAQQELKKEMTLLQKKILMDMQQQQMADVRKSIHSMLF
ncbi:synaptonemal complex protein 3 [Salarias fasciatus]|uniref:synaptonemal complex protein 3 n=1 Tax=Salarias fasciatus TaxID=181472 RepID=UPI00117687E9|nr:synaptonemal complex protein 3 [Salarias fasciatus]